MLHSPQILLASRGSSVIAAPAAMSLVLASASNQFLTRTWGSAPTDPTKLTLSLWFKFVTVPTDTRFWYTTSASGARLFNMSARGFVANFGLTDDSSSAYNVTGGSGVAQDTTNWHHFCLQLDSNQTTNALRGRMYIDGTEVTYNAQTSTQFDNWQATPNGVQSFFGQISYNLVTASPNIKVAYLHLIDGTAPDYTAFTTGTAGVGNIHPATYAGSFGTNGFLLNFSGSNTNDHSGNPTPNNWTQNNSPTFSADLPT